MSIFSSEFGRDVGRAREILHVFARHRIALPTAQGLGDGADDPSPQGGQDPALDAMSTGQRLGAALTELGTTWIKLGQSLSMRADLVGADVARDLESLQTSVPTDHPGVPAATIERELGRPLAALFASFEEEPLASGSVAQVHRAVLPDGTDVVVKVIHDGATERVTSDLALMTRLAAFAERVDPEVARYHPTVIVKNFATMMERAVDLRNELSAMQRSASDLAELEWLRVPRAFAECSAKSVLTMEYMDGIQVRHAEDVEAAGWTVNDMVTRVNNAWLEMIFSNGLYHADPHPGNFLIADSEHLILLDYGDMGFLSKSSRDQVARLLLALTARDVGGLTNIVLDICKAPETTDADAVEGAIDAWLTQYFPENTASRDRDLNAAMVAGMEYLHEFDLSFPSELAMLMRVMVRLEGFGKQLDSTVTTEEQLGPFLQKFILRENDLSHLTQRVMRQVAELGQIARDLPRDVGGLMRALRTGKARVEINMRDPDELVDKVVDGLVAAAALIAAAQLLSRSTPPRVKDVSVPGLAAALFSAVTWRNLTIRRRAHRTIEQRVASVVRGVVHVGR